MTADSLRIALLQLGPPASSLDALNAGVDACREAAGQGADLVLFPEMWNIGYAPSPPEGEARRAWLNAAILENDPWLAAFRLLAVELGLAIAVTCLERTDAGPRNALFLFDRAGRLVLRYAKVHTCSFDWESILVAGESFPVAELDTRAGLVRIGAMICFDREFPESARALALNGAELILVPNACEMEANRISLLRARAFENMAAVALANYPAPFANGSSMLLDGVPFTAEGVSRDMTVAVAGAGPAIEIADLDLQALRDARAREPWGATRFRRPAAYR